MLIFTDFAINVGQVESVEKTEKENLSNGVPQPIYVITMISGRKHRIKSKEDIKQMKRWLSWVSQHRDGGLYEQF